MAQQTALALDQMAQRVFEVVDALDTGALKALVTDDCEGVDEISRGWMRGRPAVVSYFEQALGAISDVHTSVRDVATREWGDTGIVTCVIDQTYVYAGHPHSVTAPTTIVARREAGDWHVALMHTVPLPDAPA